MDFEWDAVKELANIRKDKVSFPEAVETFLDPNGLQLVDRKHSRRDDKIRIIGCAEMRRFRRLYNETTKAE